MIIEHVSENDLTKINDISFYTGNNFVLGMYVIVFFYDEES